jgi:hypothetical protein
MCRTLAGFIPYYPGTGILNLQYDWVDSQILDLLVLAGAIFKSAILVSVLKKCNNLIRWDHTHVLLQQCNRLSLKFNP